MPNWFKCIVDFHWLEWGLNTAVVVKFVRNFQPQHQPQLGASFSHGLTSVSRVQRRVVILHAKTPIGAYNDVRVEVCIIILERVFMMYSYRVYHIKSIYFSKSAAGFGRVARSFLNWTCPTLNKTPQSEICQNVDDHRSGGSHLSLLFRPIVRRTSGLAH